MYREERVEWRQGERREGKKEGRGTDGVRHDKGELEGLSTGGGGSLGVGTGEDGRAASDGAEGEHGRGKKKEGGRGSDGRSGEEREGGEGRPFAFPGRRAASLTTRARRDGISIIRNR